MENSFDENIRLEKARKRVKAIKGFYKHLTVYVLVNILLWILNIADRHKIDDFFEWNNFTTAFFWGIGLFFHWLGTFKPNFWTGRKWEERKIQEYMDREKTRKQQWE